MLFCTTKWRAHTRRMGHRMAFPAAVIEHRAPNKESICRKNAQSRGGAFALSTGCAPHGRLDIIPHYIQKVVNFLDGFV